MPNVIENAKKRLAAIKEEAEEIERFLAMYDRFNGGTNADPFGAASGKEPTEAGSVDNSLRRRARIKGARPDEVAFHMERVIRDRGEPMSRSEIVRALESRDILIPAIDKSRYVGTIAWRNKGTFKNIEGRGYWLCKEAEPPIKPATPQSGEDEEGQF